jgi:hypothetical protein
MNRLVFVMDTQCVGLEVLSEYYLLGCDAVQSDRDPPRFRKNILFSLQPSLLLVSCLADSATLKMEAVHSSERSVRFYRTIRRYIPENSIL